MAWFKDEDRSLLSYDGTLVVFLGSTEIKTLFNFYSLANELQSLTLLYYFFLPLTIHEQDSESKILFTRYRRVLLLLFK